MDVLGMVLAGGKGERLYPLTLDRSKPAVPIGGKFRLIDFVLSNLVNSGIESIYVLTQYKAQSLIRHLEQGWRVADLRGERFISIVPPQMRIGSDWYQGTADAVFQNLGLIERHDPRLVAVFGADHIYRMNVSQMIREHDDVGADVTVAALPVPIEEARAYGVLEVDPSGRIVAFHEKPEHPVPLPNEPGLALASMGNYVFGTSTLLGAIEGKLDFGKEILPNLIHTHHVHAFDFRRSTVPLDFKDEEASYWRDVGTLDAYYEANMDLRAVSPVFNLYNRSWPIRTLGYGGPPAKFVFDDDKRTGVAINSIVAEGTIVSGSRIQGCVIGQNVRIHSYCEIENSILMDWVEVGRGCKIKGAIIDKFNTIAPGTSIGYDPEQDRSRFVISDKGIVVVARGPEKSSWVTISR